MQNFKRFLCLGWFLVLVSCIWAQPSDDAGFNIVDQGFKGIGFTANSVTTAIYRNQTDGSLLVAGLFTRYNGETANRLARLSATGMPDGTFSSGAGVAGGFTPETGMPSTGRVTKILPLTEGRFLLIGNFRTYNGVTRGGIVRIQADGQNDPTFNAGGEGPNGLVNDAVVLPDGDIIIGGTFTQFNGVAAPRLARLSSNGELRAAFNPGTGPNSGVFSLDLLSTGALVAAGSFTSFNGTTVRRIALVNPTSGELENSLSGITTTPNAAVSRIKVLANDQIVCAGAFNSFNGVTVGRITVIQGNSGAFIPEFSAGTGFNGEVKSIHVLQDGKLLIGGAFTAFNGTAVKRVVLLNASGSISSDFNVSGYGPGNGQNGATVEFAIPASPGRYLIGGAIKEWELISVYGLVQVMSNGNLDEAFNPATGVSSAANVNLDANEPATPSVNCIVPAAEGKLLIGGHFTRYNGKPRRFLARLLSNGLLDETFDPGGLQGVDNIVNAVTTLPDGKIVVAGRFLFFGNIRRNNLLRLNANGTLDPDWNPVNQLNGRIGGTGDVQVMLPMPEDKLLIAGGFNNFNLVNTIRGMVILNADGSVDASFNSAIQSGTVRAVLRMPDGKFIVGGSFISVNTGSGNVTRSLFRLNADGSYDATFNNGGSTTTQDVTCIVQLSNNRIAVGGSFTSMNGSTRRGLALLNSDGTLRDEFATLRSGSVTNLRVLNVAGIKERPDGSLLIAGQASNATSSQRSGVTIISPDGSIPSEVFNSSFRLFGSYTAPDQDNFTEAELRAVYLTDDAAVVGGLFTRSGQRSRNNITRLLISGGTTVPVRWGHFEVVAQSGTVMLKWSTQTEQNNRGFYIERSGNGNRFDVAGFVLASGTGNSNIVQSYYFTDSKLAPGTYFYRLRQVDADGTFSHSEVRKVVIGSQSEASIYPNPLPNEFTLLPVVTGTCTLSFMDVRGKVLAQQIIATQATIPALVRRPALLNGIYFLKVEYKDTGIAGQVLRVIVE